MNSEISQLPENRGVEPYITIVEELKDAITEQLQKSTAIE